MKTTNLNVPGYERVILGEEEDIGYRGIIAIHSTSMGPAVGGTRLKKYDDTDQALLDVLRLARGMTYKNALVGLPYGGGKSVIIENGHSADRETLFRSHGRFVNQLMGKFITAEDFGTFVQDMQYVRKETTHVIGFVDPSPRTARGVLLAMEAAAQHHWGSRKLTGKIVAIQGCGKVGQDLARRLHQAGAKLIVSDKKQVQIAEITSKYAASTVAPEKIYSVPADIFAPCAEGAILNDQTIPELQVELVVGAANNQLEDETRHGDQISARGILYAPDYAVNAGGLISCCAEMQHPSWTEEEIFKRIDSIYDALLNIFAIARANRIPTYRAANMLAEQRFNGV